MCFDVVFIYSRRSPHPYHCALYVTIISCCLLVTLSPLYYK